MRRDDSAIPSMVPTTRSTASRPRWATLLASVARVLACTAASALCRTVARSSSMLAAISSRLEAVCSVRADRSLLPAAISLLAPATDVLAWRMPTTNSARRACMPARRANRARSSSRLPVCGSGTAEVRSPSAMRSVTSVAWARGRRMERDSSQAQARLSNRPTSEPAASSVCLGVRCARRPHGPLPRAGAGIRPACSPLPHRHQPQAAAGWQWRPAAKPRPPCGALQGHPAPCESHCQPCRWRRIAPETPHLPPAHPGACALQRNGPRWFCGRLRCARRKLGCRSLTAFPRGRS